MDVLEFEINPRTELFERNGKAMKITFNADAFTPEYHRNVAKRFREVVKRVGREDELTKTKIKKAKKEGDNAELAALEYDQRARVGEAEREIYAGLLVGTPEVPVLMEWELTRKVLKTDDENEQGGVVVEPIPVTEEELMKLKPQLVLRSEERRVGKEC